MLKTPAADAATLNNVQIILQLGVVVLCSASSLATSLAHIYSK